MSPLSPASKIALGAALATTVVAPTVALAGELSSGSKRIPICHATSSASNPYVTNRPAADSIVSAVHGGAIEGHGTHENDIIPAFSFVWRGREYSFPGQNLDERGAAILANNCRVPTPRAPGDPSDPSTPTGGTPTGGTPGGGTPTGGTPGGIDPTGDDPTGDDPTGTDVDVIIAQSPIDDIAPRGLGITATERTLASASPDEAVLRVTIRPSSRRPYVRTPVVFTVTGRSLGPAPAQKPVLCATIPARFSLSSAGGAMILGRVLCWTSGNSTKGTSVRRFTAVPTASSAGRTVPSAATNSADNAYRVEDATTVRPRIRTTPAVVG